MGLFKLLYIWLFLERDFFFFFLNNDDLFIVLFKVFIRNF
jgi:hypothetical protein